MPKISELSSASGTTRVVSTSEMVVNVGSTTMRATVTDIISGFFSDSTRGAMLWAASSLQALALAPPSSGAVMTYTSGPAGSPSWSVPTSGAILIASSLGVPTWLAIGSSGQILQTSGGTPTWVAAPTSGHITTAGTSGQVLQTTGGAATWVNSTTIPGTLPSTAGTSGQILQTTGGVAAWKDQSDLTAGPSTGHISTIGTSGQILQSTGGAATWVGLTAGGLLYGNSSGEIAVLAQGSSGQILQTTGGIPTWVNP